MKIVVIGTRGIPEIQGGVETHCQQLYPRLAAMGHDVTVIRRPPYVDGSRGMTEYKGVKLCDVYAPRRKSLEAIVHTALAVIKARALGPDILHIHAVGPALLTPFARLLGMKVVTTNHGPDYNRKKWGGMARRVLKAGERMGAKFSNRVIVISKTIAGILADNYGRHDTDLIFNGVEKPVKSIRTDYIESLGLVPLRYVVAVGRFVEEKGFHQLIEAWTKLNLPDYRLVIAGDADHPDEYSERLCSMAREAGVVLPGFIKGEKLNQIFSHAALFAMPSSHEGLPIALLEAMSYDLDVIVSDIDACMLPELNADDHYPLEDTEALARAIERKLSNPRTPREHDLSAYNWDTIARQTEEVYRRCVAANV